MIINLILTMLDYGCVCLNFNKIYFVKNNLEIYIFFEEKN